MDGYFLSKADVLRGSGPRLGVRACPARNVSLLWFGDRDLGATYVITAGKLSPRGFDAFLPLILVVIRARFIQTLLECRAQIVISKTKNTADASNEVPVSGRGAPLSQSASIVRTFGPHETITRCAVPGFTR